MRSLSLFGIFLTLTLIFALPALAEKGGGATPEEVFGKALKANEQRDMRALVALVAPSEQGRAVLDIFEAAAGMCLGSPEEATDLCELLRRHKLEAAMAGLEKAQETELMLGYEEGKAAQMKRASTSFAQTDVPLFSQELMEIFLTMGASDDDDLFTYKSIHSVKIDGDEAVGQEDNRNLNFRRENGRWFLGWRALM